MEMQHHTGDQADPDVPAAMKPGNAMFSHRLPASLPGDTDPNVVDIEFQIEVHDDLAGRNSRCFVIA